MITPLSISAAVLIQLALRLLWPSVAGADQTGWLASASLLLDAGLLGSSFLFCWTLACLFIR